MRLSKEQLKELAVAIFRAIDDQMNFSSDVEPEDDDCLMCVAALVIVKDQFEDMLKKRGIIMECKKVENKVYQ